MHASSSERPRRLGRQDSGRGRGRRLLGREGGSPPQGVLRRSEEKGRRETAGIRESRGKGSFDVSAAAGGGRRIRGRQEMLRRFAAFVAESVAECAEEIPDEVGRGVPGEKGDRRSKVRLDRLRSRVNVIRYPVIR